MKYSDIIYGRKERTLTIFVPSDCKNCCKFCTTKHEYANISDKCTVAENTEKICQQLLCYVSSGFFTHIVFTGGEPFNDLDGLSKMVEVIRSADIDKKAGIYINTTLSFSGKELDNVLKWILKNRENLAGVSISRPIGDNTFYKNEEAILKTIEFGKKHKLDAMSELKKNRFPLFRLNAYVDRSESEKSIKNYLEKWTKQSFFKEISFRSDYVTTTQETLHSANDKFFQTLMRMSEIEFLGSTQCLVCHTDIFKNLKYGNAVIYHRGVRTTSLLFGKKLIINDFVMKQNGDMFWDWEGGDSVSVDKNKQVLNELFRT